MTAHHRPARLRSDHVMLERVEPDYDAPAELDRILSLWAIAIVIGMATLKLWGWM